MTGHRSQWTRTVGAAIAAGVLAFVLYPTRADATTIGLTTPFADLGMVDWATWAPEFSFVPNGTTMAVPGLPGLNLTVSETAGFDPLRLSQDPGSFPGNFAPGDALLYSFGGGPMNFLFSSPISAFGEQIQPGVTGAFTARIEAFDAANHSLGFFTESGLSTQAGDDSAIFIGLASNALDIRRINLSLISAPPGGDIADFAVNDPSISAVPEPASLLLFGSGLAGVAACRRRRRPAVGPR